MLLHRQDAYKGNPWQPWTQNLYTYVGNNPVNYVDPTGHSKCTPEEQKAGDCKPTDDGKATTKAYIDSASAAAVTKDGADSGSDPISNMADTAQQTLLDQCSRLNQFAGNGPCVPYDTLPNGTQRLLNGAGAVATSAPTAVINPIVGIGVTFAQGAEPELMTVEGREYWHAIQYQQALQDANHEAYRIVWQEIKDGMREAWSKLRTRAVAF